MTSHDKTLELITIYGLKNKDLVLILNQSKSYVSKKISPFYDEYFSDTEYIKILTYIHTIECGIINFKN